MKFKKKIYVVTGAFSGIGLATTENLLKKNYNVIAIGKSNLKLKKMYLKFNKFKKIFDPVVCDLGNFNSVKDLSFYIKKKYQSIDGLVNNVGINPSRNNILGTNIKDWDQTLKINITSIFWITKFLIPIIKNKSSIFQLKGLFI